MKVMTNLQCYDLLPRPTARAPKAELEAVKRGKEDDLEPEHREFVPRAKSNPFGVTGTTREGDEGGAAAAGVR